MPGLASILRALQSIPGLLNRLEEAKYEHSPVMEERREKISIPGLTPEQDPEEYEVNTGEFRQVGEKRTGRPSKWGEVSAKLPGILRAGLVAAASPTPGAIGTAQDVFGGILAASDDRDKRDMLAYQTARQRRQDAMKEAEAQADIGMKQAHTDLYWKQASEPPRGQKPTQEDFIALRDRLISDGYDREAATQMAMSLLLKQFDPRMAPPRTMEAQFARERGAADTPEAAAGVTGAAQKYNESKRRAVPPMIRPITPQSMGFQKIDTTTGETSVIEIPPHIRAQQEAVRNKPKAVTQPRPVNLQRMILENGNVGTFNPRTGEIVDTGKKPGAAPKPKEDKKNLVDAFFGGGDSAKPAETKPTPKVKPGDTVRLKSGKTVTIKKVNPDGTFEY